MRTAGRAWWCQCTPRCAAAAAARALSQLPLLTSPHLTSPFLSPFPPQDFLGRYVIRGYGSCLLPTTPGRYVRIVRTFAPASSSMLQAALSWLTGSLPEFYDARFAASGKGREVVRTTSTGLMRVALSVVTKGMASHGYTNGGPPDAPDLDAEGPGFALAAGGGGGGGGSASGSSAYSNSRDIAMLGSTQPRRSTSTGSAGGAGPASGLLGASAASSSSAAAAAAATAASAAAASAAAASAAAASAAAASASGGSSNAPPTPTPCAP